MEDKTILETTGFVSEPIFTGGRRYRTAPVRRESGRRKRLSGNAKYLLVRLAVCAAVFAAVLGLKLGKNEKAIAVLGELTEGADTEDAAEEKRLGKLRFVDLPSIIDVFAPSKSFLMPVEATGYDPDAEGGLKLVSASGAEVVSPFRGKVANVGIDDSLGRFVAIITDADVEIELYGLASVDAEKGQPVERGQRWGALSGGVLTVRVYSGGRPMDAAEVFGLGKAS